MTKLELYLEHNKISDIGAARLFWKINLAKLANLEMQLIDNKISDIGAARLFFPKNLTKLVVLVIKLQEMLISRKLTLLDQLGYLSSRSRLNFNNIGDIGTRYLALALVSNNISDINID
jgi:hypothetical protein